jgi:hypothetical protein
MRQAGRLEDAAHGYDALLARLDADPEREPEPRFRPCI